MITKNNCPDPKDVSNQSLANGVFIIQQCRDCGKYFFPAAAQCAYCDAADYSWREPSGKGVVISRRQETTPQGLSSIVHVELEEGPCIEAVLIDLMVEKITIGMPVSLHIGLVNGKEAVVFYSNEQGSKEW